MVLNINGNIEICLPSTQGYRLKIVHVPQGHCWVEGDNTRSSQDSNFYGPVSCNQY